MIREGLVDEQCFESADLASLAVFFPTTQDMTDSERDVTLRKEPADLDATRLVCWINGNPTVIIKLSRYRWILREYMSKIMIVE